MLEHYGKCCGMYSVELLLDDLKDNKSFSKATDTSNTCNDIFFPSGGVGKGLLEFYKIRKRGFCKPLNYAQF